MATDIGPKIGIDGEKEFRDALNNINQQLKTLGSEMKAVTSEFEDNADSQESLAKQAQVLNKQLEVQEKKVSELQKGLAAATEKFGESDTKTLKWAEAVNNATADLNKMRSQLSKVESEMDGAANATDDMGDALDDIDDSATKASKGLDTLTVAAGNLVAQGISAVVSGIADMVSSLWNLDESTEEYRTAMGKLNTAFEAAGYSPETAQKAYTEFYKILGDTDQATEASQLLASLAMSEQDMIKWTEIATGVYGTFGDSLPIESLIEAANETAKVGTVTGTLADALNWAGISEEEFNEQLAACGSEAERNQLILNTLGTTYEEAARIFEENNGVLMEARENQKQLQDSLSGLGTTIADLKNQAANQLLPAVQSIVTAFNGMLTGVEGSDQAFADAITQMIQALGEMLPNVVATGSEILLAVAQGIIEAIPELLAVGAEIIGQLVISISEALPELLNSGMEMLQQLATGIEQGLPDLVARLPQIVEGILTFFTENLESFLQKGVEILQSIINGIINSIPNLIEALPQVITAFMTFIAENLPTIIEAGVNLLLSLIEGIISAIPQLVESLPAIIEAIVTGILDLMSNIVDVGKDIVEGIWEGISSMASWIAGKVGDFFSGIIDGAKSLLGIASPSKVFAGIGENMALGVGEGWDSAYGAIRRDITRGMTFPVTPSIDRGTVAVPETTQESAAGGTYRIEVPLYINGRELYRATLNDLKNAINNSARSSGLTPTLG